MPITIGSRPEDYTIDDLIHVDRWMCPNCGLILDYKFDPLEDPWGWPRFEPALDNVHFWVDEDGYHVEEPERNEFCPRCDIPFEQFPPMLVIVREVRKLSDFYQAGEGEGETLELKEKFSTDRIRDTMAAFANTAGGKIVLGVTRQGVPVGYEGDEDISTAEGKDKLQQRIRGLLDKIDPKVQIKVYFVDNEASMHFAVITVPKGSSPIYTMGGKVYIRELDQNRPATSEEIVKLVGQGQAR
jgi:ribosomal protein S27AE